MSRRLYRALLVLVVALAPACGGSADPGSPAEAVPAGAFVYGEATVRPEGEAGESARALLRRLLGEDDPGRAIDDLFEDDASGATFSEDVEPWLGDRVGGFVSKVEPEAEAAVLIATTDEDEARKAIAANTDDDAQETEHRGVTVTRDGDGAVAVFDGLVASGTRAGVRVAIDVARGEREPLSASGRYRETIAELDADRLAHVYVDFGRLMEIAGERLPAAVVGDPEAFVERVRALDRPTGALELLARDDAVVFQTAADVETLREFGYVGPSTDSNATELTGELPADATVAVGITGLGDFVRAGLEDPLRLGITAADARSATRFWREYTGTDLDTTLKGIGDAALYATGPSLDQLKAGMLVEGDPSRVLASVRGLAARLGEGASLSIRRTARGVRITDPDLPRAIEAEDRGGRLAGSYGVSPSAVASPRARLTDASGFMRARAQLGEGFEPTVYVSVPPLLGFLRSLGVGEGLDVSGAAAYLIQLDNVTQGEKVEGDRLVTRTVVGLRP